MTVRIHSFTGSREQVSEIVSLAFSSPLSPHASVTEVVEVVVVVVVMLLLKLLKKKKKTKRSADCEDCCLAKGDNHSSSSLGESGDGVGGGRVIITQHTIKKKLTAREEREIN